ncbi:hypothetical protein [Jannaschia sp. R86511]|uniref:hypothetical protein n=1 Tax=Jannaschia sp. R86511 TaxID=3093853 RepID=UPI0036D25200
MTSLTRATASRPGRRAVAPVATAVAAGLLLGGCSFTSRDLTLEPYAPSDGLQTDLGDVLVRNVLVVSEGDGAPGVVSGALVNRGEEDATVQVEVGGTLAEVDVAAGETVFLGAFAEPDGVLVVVDAVDPIAGDVIDVVFTDPAQDSATLAVVVALPEGPYAEITPPATAVPPVGASAEPSLGTDVEPSAGASVAPAPGASVEPTAVPTTDS